MLSRVSLSSATTRAMRLKPPMVLKMWITLGQSLNRSRRLCVASALSISSNTMAGKRLKDAGLSKADTLMASWSSNFCILFLIPILVNPTILANSSSVVRPSC